MILGRSRSTSLIPLLPVTRATVWGNHLEFHSDDSKTLRFWFSIALEPASLGELLREKKIDCCPVWVALVGMSKYQDVKYTVGFFFGRKAYSQRDQHKNIDRSANLFLRGQNREVNQKKESNVNCVMDGNYIPHSTLMLRTNECLEKDITLFNQLQDTLRVEVDEIFVPCRGIAPLGYPQD